MAGTVVLFFDDGAEGFELAQALADGALAHVEAPGDFFHAERLFVGEEETVDLSVGLGIAEQFGEVGEDLDKAGFVISREEGAWSVERARRRGRGFEI